MLSQENKKIIGRKMMNSKIIKDTITRNYADKNVADKFLIINPNANDLRVSNNELIFWNVETNKCFMITNNEEIVSSCDSNEELLQILFDDAEVSEPADNDFSKNMEEIRKILQTDKENLLSTAEISDDKVEKEMQKMFAENLSESMENQEPDEKNLNSNTKFGEDDFGLYDFGESHYEQIIEITSEQTTEECRNNKNSCCATNSFEIPLIEDQKHEYCEYLHTENIQKIIAESIEDKKQRLQDIRKRISKIHIFLNGKRKDFERFQEEKLRKRRKMLEAEHQKTTNIVNKPNNPEIIIKSNSQMPNKAPSLPINVHPKKKVPPPVSNRKMNYTQPNSLTRWRKKFEKQLRTNQNNLITFPELKKSKAKVTRIYTKTNLIKPKMKPNIAKETLKSAIKPVVKDQVKSRNIETKDTKNETTKLQTQLKDMPLIDFEIKHVSAEITQNTKMHSVDQEKPICVVSTTEKIVEQNKVEETLIVAKCTIVEDVSSDYGSPSEEGTEHLEPHQEISEAKKRSETIAKLDEICGLSKEKSLSTTTNQQIMRICETLIAPPPKKTVKKITTQDEVFLQMKMLSTNVNSSTEKTPPTNKVFTYFLKNIDENIYYLSRSFNLDAINYTFRWIKYILMRKLTKMEMAVELEKLKVHYYRLFHLILIRNCGSKISVRKHCECADKLNRIVFFAFMDAYVQKMVKYIVWAFQNNYDNIIKSTELIAGSLSFFMDRSRLLYFLYLFRSKFLQIKVTTKPQEVLKTSPTSLNTLAQMCLLKQICKNPKMHECMERTTEPPKISEIVEVIDITKDNDSTSNTGSQPVVAPKIVNSFLNSSHSIEKILQKTVVRSSDDLNSTKESNVHQVTVDVPLNLVTNKSNKQDHRLDSSISAKLINYRRKTIASEQSEIPELQARSQPREENPVSVNKVVPRSITCRRKTTESRDFGHLSDANNSFDRNIISVGDISYKLPTMPEFVRNMNQRYPYITVNPINFATPATATTATSTKSTASSESPLLFYSTILQNMGAQSNFNNNGHPPVAVASKTSQPCTKQLSQDLYWESRADRKVTSVRNNRRTYHQKDPRAPRNWREYGTLVDKSKPFTPYDKRIPNSMSGIDEKTSRLENSKQSTTKTRYQDCVNQVPFINPVHSYFLPTDRSLSEVRYKNCEQHNLASQSKSGDSVGFESVQDSRKNVVTPFEYKKPIHHLVPNYGQSLAKETTPQASNQQIVADDKGIRVLSSIVLNTNENLLHPAADKRIDTTEPILISDDSDVEMSYTDCQFSIPADPLATCSSDKETQVRFSVQQVPTVQFCDSFGPTVKIVDDIQSKKSILLGKYKEREMDHETGNNKSTQTKKTT